MFDQFAVGQAVIHHQHTQDGAADDACGGANFSIRVRFVLYSKTADQQCANLFEVFFQDDAKGADFGCGPVKAGLVVIRDHHDADAGLCGQDGARSVKAGGAGHSHVHRYGIGFELKRRAHGFVAGGTFADNIAGRGDRLADRLAHACIVINDHEFHNATAGSSGHHHDCRREERG